MFICGGKRQKIQMRTIHLQPHTFTLKNNTEDILKITYNPEKLMYESQDKEMLIKGKKLQQLHQFNEVNLLQQIDDQIIDIEKAKQKKQAKAAEIAKLEAEILQNEIDINVIQIMLKNDEMIVENLQKCDIKYAVDLQEKYQKLLKQNGDDDHADQQSNKQLLSQKSHNSQNQSFMDQASKTKRNSNSSGRQLSEKRN